MVVLVLLVLAAILYGIYRACPALSKAWRPKIRKDRDVVYVVLAARFSRGYYSQDRLMISPRGYSAADPKLKEKLRADMETARNRADAINKAHKL